MDHYRFALRFCTRTAVPTCSNETMASRIGTAQSDYDLLELPEKVV